MGYKKTQEEFEKEVYEYHHGRVKILSKYNGSDNPVDLSYFCDEHGIAFATMNAKNICKPYFLPCKSCQAKRKSIAAKKTDKKNKKYYYQRLVNYCAERGGTVLEKEWTTAKAIYHIKCADPAHPIFTSTADSLYSGKHWCPYCSGRLGDFQQELSDICRKKNGELLSPYVDATTPMIVRCNKHNYKWAMLPGNLRKGRWCPVCSMGFNEKVVYDYFVKMHCNFQIQYAFDDLTGKNNEKLRFDFAILNSKNDLVYLIEVDDEEHRDYHCGNTPRQLERIKSRQRDKEKDAYCKEYNIPLHRMEVPFRNRNKWSYDDYYRYINSELKEFVILAQQEEKC